jgi:hypothetical protein
MSGLSLSMGHSRLMSRPGFSHSIWVKQAVSKMAVIPLAAWLKKFEK